MTPFEKKFPNAVKGVTEFVVAVDGIIGTASIGDIVTLSEDDGSHYPYFNKYNNRYNYCININRIKLKENTMNKTIEVVDGNIDIPEGYKVVSIQVKKEVNKRPRSWEEYQMQSGIPNECTSFPEEYKALRKLKLMRDVWVDGWVADYGTANQTKHCVLFHGCKPTIKRYALTSLPLSFPTNEMSEDFLEAHKELIETAKPLL